MTTQTDNTALQGARQLMLLVRDSCDSGDPWGTCMAWLFATADYMTTRGLPVPDEWQFRPSPFGADTEAYEFQLLQEAAPTEEALQLFGRGLWIWRNRLDRQGMGY